MIDRIEELLGSLAAEEDDEEQQEDVLALTTKEEAVSVPPGGDEGEAGEVETGDRSGGRTALEIALERPGLTAGETETEAEGAQADRELWKDGPVWTVRGGSPELDEALRASTAERTGRTEEFPQPLRDGDLIWSGSEQTARGGTTGPDPEGAERSGPEQAGLKGLYRQTVQGLRPAAPALPPEQAGRAIQAQEPGSAASLAVDELDRAVRRDSRRYDGGMSIY